MKRKSKTRKRKNNIIFIIILGTIVGLLAVFLVPLIISMIAFYWPYIWYRPPHEKTYEALIIDTVCLSKPNPKLINNLTNLLHETGYKVFTYEGTNVTINLMKKLTMRNYKIIIFRVHSTYTEIKLNYLPKGTVVIITGERYVKSKYVMEQLMEYLIPSSIIPELGIVYGYFAITPRFITSLPGKFNGTIVIAMGCNTLHTISMAKAFISKGAAVYIGWDNYVTPVHMDKALYLLLQYLLKDRMTVATAVAKVNKVLGPDPYYNAKLVYYPPEAGGIKVPIGRKS